MDDKGNIWGVENGMDNLNRADLGGDIHLGNPAEEVVCDLAFFVATFFATFVVTFPSSSPLPKCPLYFFFWQFQCCNLLEKGIMGQDILLFSFFIALFKSWTKTQEDS